MSVHAFRSRRVVSADGMRAACVLVDDASGRIVGIEDEAPAGVPVQDFGEDALMPGVVDSHVHINEPGRTEWEGFETGTRAAAAGGVTTIVDMPLNCLPETTNVAALEEKRRAAAGKCWVDWRPWGGAVNGNQGSLAGLAEAGVPGFKCFLLYPGCDGFGLIDERDLRAAMPVIARTGLPLLVHAELAGPCEEAVARLAGADWGEYGTYLASRPDEAELRAIELMIGLSRVFGCWVHIVHLSSALALPMLRSAKREGLRVSVETCPHYLFFCAEEIGNGEVLYKCAPPIRSGANREELWGALRDGTIDLVASDHSPCPVEMKVGSFGTAWGGVAGISLSLAVVWTEASRRGFGLEDVGRWMSAGPARLAGLEGQKGRIEVGFDADFVVFGAEERFVVDEERLHFRHKASPYLGRELMGVVKKTFLRGKCVFDGGEFLGEARGMEVFGG